MRELEYLGYQVEAANNGGEAVEALREGPYDLVLMDCQMPELDGYEATRRIRAAEPEGERIPIIAVTAHALSDHRQRCLDAGMDDFISKPYGDRELAAVIDHWLGLDLEGADPLLGGLGPEPAGGPALQIGKDFDDAALASLRKLEETTGQPLIRGLVESFSRRSSSGLEAIRESLGRGDGDAVQSLAHGLRGASAQLGATRLAEGLRAIEELATEGKLERCRRHLDELEQVLPAILRRLEMEASTPGEPKEMNLKADPSEADSGSPQIH